jgi:hypothetical protein
MKKFTKTRKVVTGLAIVVGITVSYPTYAKFMGWERDSAFAFSCNGSGAYTMEEQTLYIFGIPVDTRTVYRNAMGEVLAEDPCSN